LSYHNRHPFSTKDQDNDQNSGNCAVDFHGAWWYNSCYNSNLNGRYQNVGPDPDINGIDWSTWNNAYFSMKHASMKIRPN